MNQSFAKFEKAKETMGRNRYRKNLISQQLNVDNFIHGFLDAFDPLKTGKINIAELEMRLQAMGTRSFEHSQHL